MNRDYIVNEYRRVGSELRFVSTISGLGRNKNTWDTSHGRSTAFAHAKRLNADTYKPKDTVYRAETR